MRLVDLYGLYSARRHWVLAGSFALTVLIAVADWKIERNLSLGFLYIFPLILAAGVLNPIRLVGFASVCAALRELLGPFRGQPGMTARLGVVWIAFSGTALFFSELLRFHRYRAESEEQLRALVESSPLAILTLNAKGKVLLANEAAHRLLALESRPLQGVSLAPYIPSLVLASGETAPAARSMMECRGRRANGEIFPARIWFSTCRTSAGPLVAALILDVSQDLREREEQDLDLVRAASRILVGAVSHELRNLCWAASAVYGKLTRMRAVAEDEDFKALGSLVKGLEQIAAAELQAQASTEAASDVADVLEELRIIAEPGAQAAGVRMEWRLEEGLPPVRGEHRKLLQVCLNLVNNSLRALETARTKELEISASREGDLVSVRLHDSGPGIPAPEALFRPFAKGAESAGLGLYVSRAILRSFGGDLRYEPRPAGCCFVLELAPATRETNVGDG